VALVRKKLLGRAIGCSSYVLQKLVRSQDFAPSTFTLWYQVFVSKALQTDKATLTTSTKPEYDPTILVGVHSPNSKRSVKLVQAQMHARLKLFTRTRYVGKSVLYVHVRVCVGMYVCVCVCVCVCV